MADDSTDIANEEELVIFFCTKQYLTVFVKVIFDVIHRMGLSTENARGQCYEGAATLSGTNGGVTTKIKSLNEIGSEMLKYQKMYGR